MKSQSILAVVLSCWFVTGMVLGQDANDEEEYTGPIAISGGVHLNGIEISRKVAAGAKKDVKLSRLHLTLWFPGDDPPAADASYTIRLHSLQPIEDDQGTELLTDDRQDWIRELRGDAAARSIRTMRGKQGPELSFDLNVSDRKAATLKKVKGVVEIRKASSVVIAFEKIADKLGDELEDDQLGDFKIVPLSIEAVKGQVKCKLRLPKEHSRLDDWTLMKDGKPLRPVSIGSAPTENKELIEETRTFVGKSVEDLALHLRFDVTSEPQRYEFEFLDVPLP